MRTPDYLKGLTLDLEVFGTRGQFAASLESLGGVNMSACPFCASYNVRPTNTWTPYYHVVCDNCGAVGPGSRSPKRNHFATVGACKAAHRRAIVEAIRLWDQRL